MALAGLLSPSVGDPSHNAHQFPVWFRTCAIDLQSSVYGGSSFILRRARGTLIFAGPYPNTPLKELKHRVLHM